MRGRRVLGAGLFIGTPSMFDTKNGDQRSPNNQNKHALRE